MEAEESYSVCMRNGRKFKVMAMRSDGGSDRSELDSHADTTVGGLNCVLLCAGNETATVHSFSEESKAFKNVPIGTIATAWVDPKTSEMFILVFPESLYFDKRLCHSLLCPNQLRANGALVNDVPRQFDRQSTHSIVVLGDEDGNGVEIPLESDERCYFVLLQPSSFGQRAGQLSAHCDV